MNWIRKVIIALWAIAAILVLFHSVIDWDEAERRKVENRMAQLLDVQSNVFRLLITGYSEKAELDLTGSPYNYRIFENGELVKWSDNRGLPAYSQLRQPDSLYYLEHSSGKYIVYRKSIQSENTITDFFSILILEENFQILNEYLRTQINPSVFSNTPQLVGLGEAYPISYKGKELFTILPSGTAKYRLLSIAIWIMIASIPFILVELIRVLKRRFGEKSILMIIPVLVVFRVILWLLEFPDKWIDAKIFDKVFYNSSLLNFSLGDLLLNYSFLVLIAALIGNAKEWKGDAIPRVIRPIIVFGSALLAYLNIWFFYWVIGDIITHSQVEFDITHSIQFDLERIAAFIVILISSALYFLVNHVLARITSEMKVVGGVFLLIHLVTLALFIWLFQDLFPLFILQFAWYWILYLTDLSLKFVVVRKVALEYVLSVAAILSLSFAFTVFHYHNIEDLDEKKKFANKLILEKDVLGEFYLNEILNEFRADRSIEERLNGGIFARQNIREKVRRQFVSSYFDKYELEIFLFNTNGEMLDVEGDSFEVFRSTQGIKKYETDYEGIYLIDDSENISLRKYTCLLTIGDEGFMVINLNRKRNIPTSVFPELLVESRYEQESSYEYDYTIFRDSVVLYGYGNFGHSNYLNSQHLENPELFDEGISLMGRHFYGMKTQDGRTIVIFSEAYPNRNWVTNFSFLFLLYIVLISVVGLIYRLVLNFKTLTLANKIQLYLALGFLVPLFVTGLTLLNTLNKSYKEEITRSYLKESLRISANLVDETIRYANNASNLNQYASYVGDVSGFVQADLNVYDAKGHLITTSQPGIFGLNLLSDKINPIALKALSDDNQNIILDESIGLLDYKTTYTTISGYTDGQIYGILALPFFESKNHLRLQQKEVFANLLMIFALIFLFALISGNYILNYLIGPLKVLTNHLKQTSWEDNQAIYYSRDDEIGVLVKEYNQMLIKLDRNREALARSQKESAWKEIAKQVAHEIKNPLTPMRLKIQQMQRDTEDESKVKVLQSLIKQIDTLSDIADSFSEFAKMPAPENVDFDLVEVVSEATQLHVGKKIKISAHLPLDKVMVWADPKIMARVLNNLILNAIQAIEGKEPEIEIRMWLDDNKVLVSCEDNGSGIPEDIQDKIFTTYFSTKSTGSGIGLAVAKKGIENAGGDIWFETEEGKGTIFYISLPVVADV